MNDFDLCDAACVTVAQQIVRWFHNKPSGHPVSYLLCNHVQEASYNFRS